MIKFVDFRDSPKFSAATSRQRFMANSLWGALWVLQILWTWTLVHAYRRTNRL